MSTGNLMPDVVGYTVKELFEKIDKKLDVMSTIISSKADHSDLVNIQDDIRKLDARVDELEKGVASKGAVEANENRLLATERKLNNNRSMLIIGGVGLLAQLGATLALFLQMKH